jgi:hypothetical protein
MFVQALFPGNVSPSGLGMLIRRIGKYRLQTASAGTNNADTPRACLKLCHHAMVTLAYRPDRNRWRRPLVFDVLPG